MWEALIQSMPAHLRWHDNPRPCCKWRPLRVSLVEEPVEERGRRNRQLGLHQLKMVVATGLGQPDEGHVVVVMGNNIKYIWHLKIKHTDDEKEIKRYTNCKIYNPPKETHLQTPLYALLAPPAHVHTYECV